MQSRHRVLLSLAAAVSLGVAVLGSGGAFAASGSGAPTAQTSGVVTGTHAAGVVAGQYIVRLEDGASPAATVGVIVRRHHGSIVSVQSSLHTAVVDVDAAGAAELAQAPGVLGVSADRTATAQTLGYDPSTQGGSMTNVTRVSGAQTAWTKGYTGSGVDVALLDTGVAPVSSLSAADKVVVGPDLSFESQNANLRYLDTFGHGTHMASIIGGREVAKGSGAAYAADRTHFYGMAPDSRIVSVKVGDHNGSVDVSQLIAGIDWVVQNKYSNGLNIKVLNLSFGTDSRQAYGTDPLAYAAETAWNAGIFVVASVGNDGDASAGLADPAYDPFLFAVGAADTRGTDTMLDDSVPDFSQHPTSAFLNRPPDVVAPGVKIVAAGVPGSSIWETYPAARIGTGLLRGSGTSQAAAVASGAAALIYSKWPNLTPSQVKDLLKRTATPLIGVDPALQGSGELNVANALNGIPTPAILLTPSDVLSAVVSSTKLYLPSTGTGSLEKARGSLHASIDGVTLTGEKDIMGTAWNGTLTGPLTTRLGMWTLSTGAFNGVIWTGRGFTTDTTSWAGRTWSGRTWAGSTWTGRTWAGGAWSGRTWAAATWSGSGWSTASWTGESDATSFAGRTWSSASWAP